MGIMKQKQNKKMERIIQPDNGVFVGQIMGQIMDQIMGQIIHLVPDNPVFMGGGRLWCILHHNPGRLCGILWGIQQGYDGGIRQEGYYKGELKCRR